MAPPRPRFDRRAPVRELPNINDRISYPNLRVVDSDGSQLGVITREEALEVGKERGLDLVLVSEKADPPVCRIMDYGKYKFEKEKIFDLTNKFLCSQQFEQLFCGKVRCEIEVIGNVGNQRIIERIDLLVEREKEVLIVDYKSEEVVPQNIPQDYLKQLTSYANSVRVIYPNKKVSFLYGCIRQVNVKFLMPNFTA